MADDNFFTGSGATGQPVDEAPSAVFRVLRDWREWKRQHGGSSKGFNVNPGEIHTYAGIVPSSAAARVAQADTVFGQNIRRSIQMELRLRRLPANRWRTPAIRTEILNATSLSRGAYIGLVAPRYNLEPKLVGAIILTESRDQSELEDFADWFSMTQLGRMDTSIGLGQVTGTTAKIHGLLDDLFDHASSVPPGLLADEAVNINAVAKYLRMVANAGAQVQTLGRNDLHARDPRCTPKPSGGVYSNTALKNLSVLAGPSLAWYTLPDDNLPPSAPATIKFRSTGSTYSIPTSSEWFEKWYGNYYTRLVTTEYNSCPFDTDMLAVGITSFQDVGPSGAPDWRYLDDVFCPNPAAFGEVNWCVAGGYGQWASQALVDCFSSSRI